MSRTIRNYLKENEIIKYLLITFSLTWSVWGILYASSIGIINPDIHRYHALRTIIIGGSAPSVAAFIYSGLTSGKKGMWRLFKKILIWKVNPFWYVFAIFIIPTIYYLPAFICKLSGEQYIIQSRFSFGQLLILFIGQLFAGPISEEFGWRGFVLPRLQKRFNALISCLILGTVHAFWHIPLFFISGPYQFKQSFVLYLLIVICYSIFYGWMYNGTGGSLIPTVILHAQCNFNSNYFNIAFPQNPTIVYTVISNIFALVPLLIIIYLMLRPNYQKIIYNIEV